MATGKAGGASGPAIGKQAANSRHGLGRATPSGVRVAPPRGFRLECDLYPPVKAFLEARGYEVKGEIFGCDVVATRGTEAPVIVELKLAFNLALVLQGIDRLSLTDCVYLAVARPRVGAPGRVSPYRRSVRALCRRLGLGLMSVSPGPPQPHVEVVLDPLPYRPRRRQRKLRAVLREHGRRDGDPTPGGRSPGPVMTAYRQEALRCAMLIERESRASLGALRETALVPNAARILQRDVYGWFERVARGVYRLRPRAREDMAHFAAENCLPSLPPGARCVRAEVLGASRSLAAPVGHVSSAGGSAGVGDVAGSGRPGPDDSEAHGAPGRIETGLTVGSVPAGGIVLMRGGR